MARLFGNLRDIRRIQRAAGRYRYGVNLPVFQEEVDLHGLKHFVDIFQPGKSLPFYGLGHIRIADAVDGAPVAANTQVQISGHLCLVPVVGIASAAQHFAGLFPDAVEQCHASAIGNGIAAAGNAAGPAAAFQLTFGAAVSDDSVTLTGNTTHVTGVRRVQLAGIGAVLHKAHRLPTHDTTHALLFGGDNSMIPAACNHAAHLSGKIQRGLSQNIQIILLVQLVFQGHSAGNAAGIQVRQDTAVVGALGNLTSSVFFRIQVRHICDAAAQVVLCVLQGLTHLPHLSGNGLHILRQSRQGPLQAGGDGVGRSLHALHALGEGILRCGNGVHIRHIRQNALRVILGKEAGQRVLGSIHMVLQCIHLGGHSGCAALGVGTGRSGNAREGVHLSFQNLQGIHAELELGSRHHLSHDAAHFLTAENGSVVLTLRHKAHIAAGDTADVVAHLPVAHIRPVGTQADHAHILTGNTADVGSGSSRLRSGNTV